MSRFIQIPLLLQIDLDVWEGYEDVATELIVEDAFENYIPKDGTNLITVHKPKQLKSKNIIFSGYKPLDNLDTSNPPNGDY